MEWWTDSTPRLILMQHVIYIASMNKTKRSSPKPKKRRSRAKKIRTRTNPEDHLPEVPPGEPDWRARIDWLVGAKFTFDDIAAEVSRERQFVLDLYARRSLRPGGMAAIILYGLSEKYRPSK